MPESEPAPSPLRWAPVVGLLMIAALGLVATNMGHGPNGITVLGVLAAIGYVEIRGRRTGDDPRDPLDPLTGLARSRPRLSLQ